MGKVLKKLIVKSILILIILKSKQSMIIFCYAAKCCSLVVMIPMGNKHSHKLHKHSLALVEPNLA